MLSPKPIDILCPSCGSQKVWRDGLRYSSHNDRPIQRYICRECGYRFSETTWNGSDDSEHSEDHQRVHRQILNCDFAIPILCQVGVTETQGAKNLVKVEPQIGKAGAGATKPDQATIKGKIIEFAWQLKKDGLADSTIKLYVRILRKLVERGADIFEPESVKEVIAKQNWRKTTKSIVIAAYTRFLQSQGKTWDPPLCDVTWKFPFIPTEEEIDTLIAASGKKTAVFLQLLKETAMRAGEALRLEWSDIDFKRKTITLNQPEKRGLPRIFKVSTKLGDMLNVLPRKDEKIFPQSQRGLRATFCQTRKTAAKKLQSPRLLKIHFHTFRHWKATMLYHQTRDPIYVKEFLGHKKMEHTLRYIQLVNTIFKETTDEFTVKVTKTPEEIQQLLEVGFEYVCEKDGLMFFRKRK